MQLLMAVEQGHPRIIRHKLDLRFLVASEHDDVFENSRRRLAEDLCEFEAVAMKVNGMDVITGIAHPDAVSLALFQMK